MNSPELIAAATEGEQRWLGLNSGGVDSLTGDSPWISKERWLYN